MKLRLSPCCKAKIVKKKRFGGQVLLEYCSECNHRVWPGNKSVTREEKYEQQGAILRRLARKPKGNALADAFGVSGVEFLDALDYLAAKNKKKI